MKSDGIEVHVGVGDAPKKEDKTLLEAFYSTDGWYRLGPRPRAHLTQISFFILPRSRSPVGEFESRAHMHMAGQCDC